MPKNVERLSNIDDLILFIGACAIGAVALVVLFPESPLRSLIIERNTDALLLAELRGQLGRVTAESRWVVYFRNLLVNYFLLYIVVYFSIEVAVFGRSRGRFAAVLVIAAFCAALDLSKAPIIFVMLTPLVVRMYFGVASKKEILGYAATSAGILAALYILVMGAAGGDVFGQILHRITVAQYAGLPLTLEVFPEVVPHIGVSGSIGVLSWITGSESEFYSRTVMEFAHPEGVAAGTAGFMSTIAYAEGYAMAGIPGMLTAATIAALFISALHSLRQATELKVVALYLLILTKVPRLIVDSTSALVWNYGLILLVLVILVLRIFSTNFLPRDRPLSV